MVRALSVGFSKDFQQYKPISKTLILWAGVGGSYWSLVGPEWSRGGREEPPP